MSITSHAIEWKSKMPSGKPRTNETTRSGTVNRGYARRRGALLFIHPFVRSTVARMRDGSRFRRGRRRRMNKRSRLTNSVVVRYAHKAHWEENCRDNCIDGIVIAHFVMRSSITQRGATVVDYSTWCQSDSFVFFLRVRRISRLCSLARLYSRVF